MPSRRARWKRSQGQLASRGRDHKEGIRAFSTEAQWRQNVEAEQWHSRRGVNHEEGPQGCTMVILQIPEFDSFDFYFR